MQEISVKELFKKEVGSSFGVDVEFSPEEIDLPESITLESLKGKVKVIRLEDSVVANAALKAQVNLICDRCLDNFDTDIKFSFEKEFLLDRKQESSGDEGFVDKYLNIDIVPTLREELLLAIPTKNLCKSDCGGICLTCGLNLNHEKCKCKIV